MAWGTCSTYCFNTSTLALCACAVSAGFIPAKPTRRASSTPHFPPCSSPQTTPFISTASHGGSRHAKCALWTTGTGSSRNMYVLCHACSHCSRICRIHCKRTHAQFRYTHTPMDQFNACFFNHTCTNELCLICDSCFCRADNFACSQHGQSLHFGLHTHPFVSAPT